MFLINNVRPRTTDKVVSVDFVITKDHLLTALLLSDVLKISYTKINEAGFGIDYEIACLNAKKSIKF